MIGAEYPLLVGSSARERRSAPRASPTRRQKGMLPRVASVLGWSALNTRSWSDSSAASRRPGHPGDPRPRPAPASDHGSGWSGSRGGRRPGPAPDRAAAPGRRPGHPHDPRSVPTTRQAASALTTFKECSDPRTRSWSLSTSFKDDASLPLATLSANPMPGRPESPSTGRRDPVCPAGESAGDPCVSAPSSAARLPRIKNVRGASNPSIVVASISNSRYFEMAASTSPILASNDAAVIRSSTRLGLACPNFWVIAERTGSSSAKARAGSPRLAKLFARTLTSAPKKVKSDSSVSPASSASSNIEIS